MITHKLVPTRLFFKKFSRQKLRITIMPLLCFIVNFLFFNSSSFFLATFSLLVEPFSLQISHLCEDFGFYDFDLNRIRVFGSFIARKSFSCGSEFLFHFIHKIRNRGFFFVFCFKFYLCVFNP